MKNLLSVSAVLGLLSFVGCGGGDALHAPNSRELTLADNGTLVSVAQGDTIQVVLSGNPTTGYEWVFAGTDESILASAGSSYTPDSASAEIVGSGGTYRYLFTAVAAGEVRLRLVYKRSWETEIAEAFDVTIRIL